MTRSQQIVARVRFKVSKSDRRNVKRQSTVILPNLSGLPVPAKRREVLECGCALPLLIRRRGLTERLNHHLVHRS